MNKIIIGRLFESFTELERAIKTAKMALCNKDNPPRELMERIRSYEGILEKQRSLANALCSHVSDSNWDEVDRHVKIINALSSMIRDDAREVVSGMRPMFSPEEREAMFT